MDKYHFGQFSPEHLLLLKEGINYYNTGHYWMCHEVVEDLWMDAIGDNARYVYWVIIQLATCLYHHEDNNIDGARGMIRKAKKKIEFIENNHVESDLLYNYLNWKDLKSIVKAIPDNGSIDDFSELKSFKFNTPDSWSLEN